MSLVAGLARVSAAVNVLLLLTVGYVRADSYRQARSSRTLGMPETVGLALLAHVIWE